MNLLCPTCQKQLQVPEQYAGQMMKCPLCDNPFTVPVLPTMPQAVAPPPAAAPAPVRPPSQKLPAAAPRLDAGMAPGAASLSLNPRLIPWLAPLSLLVIFVLMFFPWVGMYPGSVGVVTQTGWQAAFGSATVDTDWYNYTTREKYWEKYYGTDVEPLRAPGVSVLLIFFALIMVPATVVAVVAEALAHRLIPIDLSPELGPFLSMRPLFVGGLALVMLALLLLVSFVGFPLEQTVTKQVEASVKTAREAASTPSAEVKDNARWVIEQGIRQGGFNLDTRPWFVLVLILNVVAVAGAGLQFWLERRGQSAPTG